MDKEQTLYPESWQIPVMKYCGKPTKAAIKQAFDSGQWIMQEKKDGALYVLEKTDSGYVYLFSRTKSKKTGELVEKSDNFPHIKEWAKMFVPKGTILIGEIYVKGGHSNDVTKLSGCTPTNAVNRQFNSDNFGGPVHYYVFDILRCEGEDIQEKGTLERLEKYLYGEQLGYMFAEQEYVERAKIYYDNFEEELQKIFSKGGEGAVFKRKDCPYRAGKRSTSNQMFKWKEHLDSVDLICVGLEDPEYYYTGKEADTWQYKDDEGRNITKPAFFGWKNSMSLGCYKDGKIVYVGKVASGLTDSMRQNMAEYPEKYLNKVIQVSCMSVDPKEGTLRHPVFEQVREDKNSEECLWEDIFEK